jgi:branched-chain amino acid transport system permease protein/neutral amino acid transport system permease protein
MHLDLIEAAVGFGLVTASILAIAALGFTLQYAITNIFNVAYGDVMTASAFAAYIFNAAGLNIWLCVVLGAVSGAVLSLALNRLLFTPFLRRRTPPYGMIIVSLAIALIIQNGLLAIGGPYFFSYSAPSGSTLGLGAVRLTESQLAIMVIAVAMMLSIHLLLKHTTLGKAMRATASNPALARISGIQTERIVNVVWLLSGALCGVAGVVLVINTASFAAPTGSSFLVIIIAAAILGGIGHPYGAILGAVTIGLATEVSAAVISPAYKDVSAFVILAVVLLVRPQGIMAVLRTEAPAA